MTIKWTTQEDEYLRENYRTKHISCVRRWLWSLSGNYRLPKAIAARYAILVAEELAVSVCPVCDAPESDVQKAYTSLHCYTVAYTCGYEIIKALSDARFIEVSVNCGGEPVRHSLNEVLELYAEVKAQVTLSKLTAEQAVAESWASIDGRTPIYSIDGLEEGMTYPNGKPVTYSSMNDHADGYECEAHELIKRLKKRGYKIVPN